jgi:hypothetical protein
MISRRQLPELQAFIRAEAGLPFRTAAEYASLVVPNVNRSRAIHQWFKYKEAFSADLLDRLLGDCLVGRPTPSRIRLLDPFCGVGTSLLSAQLLKPHPYQIASIGIECNPFSAFVARTKVSWPSIDPDRLRALASNVLSRPMCSSIQLPALSSIRSGRCMSRYMGRQLLAARAQIEDLSPSAERDALLVGLAACIEPVSKTRRDGRALRIVEKTRRTLKKLLAERWEAMARDVEAMRRACPSPPRTEVLCGDGRRPSSLGVANGSIDLILTSPPYPNNIDYTEVYKLELWFLGFATSAQTFLELRRATFRSHPTCSVATDDPDYQQSFTELLKDGPLADLLGIVTRRVSILEREKSRGRSKVLLGYVYDTWCTLQAHSRTLRSGGRAIYVVGNSLHGGPLSRPYLIPTDLIFSRLAELVGLRVDAVIVARPLLRRLAGNHFLRDSLVVLRRP